MQAETTGYLVQQPYHNPSAYEPVWGHYPDPNTFNPYPDDCILEDFPSSTSDLVLNNCPSDVTIDQSIANISFVNPSPTDYGFYQGTIFDGGVNPLSEQGMLDGTYIQHGEFNPHPNQPLEGVLSEHYGMPEHHCSSDSDSEINSLGSMTSPYNDRMNFQSYLLGEQPHHREISISSRHQFLPHNQESQLMDMNSYHQSNSFPPHFSTNPSIQSGDRICSLGQLDGIKKEEQLNSATDWPVSMLRHNDENRDNLFRDPLPPTLYPTCDVRRAQEKPIKRRTRTRRRRGTGKEKTVHLWEFIRDILLEPKHCPTLMKWEDRKTGVFRFVKSDTVALMWGRRKQNPKMTYEKLSRAMRYYYSRGILERVDGRRLVYKFGPNSFGWENPKSETEALCNDILPTIAGSNKSPMTSQTNDDIALPSPHNDFEDDRRTDTPPVLPSADVLLGGAAAQRGLSEAPTKQGL